MDGVLTWEAGQHQTPDILHCHPLVLCCHNLEALEGWQRFSTLLHLRIISL